MSDDIVELLKAHEYFSGVSDDTLREIAGLAQIPKTKQLLARLDPELFRISE